MHDKFRLTRNSSNYHVKSWRFPSEHPQECLYDELFQNRNVLCCGEPVPFALMVRSERDINSYQIFPSPDLKNTRAVDVFLRPVRRCSVFSMSYDSSNFNGCWAECSCCGPLYTFSFLNIARPSGPFGNIPLTAYSIAAVGDLLSKSSKFMLLSPPGYPEWR